MSRTVGPYNDVATARVEGAYELCEGSDEGGRPVQILTLGSTSSKDPARRGLLSDTVAWAYATAGPEDAPILVADLEAEQPYVVVLKDPRLRGADRIMDRLLALGPATGPLPVGPAAAAQRAAHQMAAAQRSAAPASPVGPPSPPPISPPVVIIAPPKKRSQLVPILVGIGSVVVILALVVGVWVLLSGGDDPAGSSAEPSDTTEAGATTEAPSEAAEEGEPENEVPQWDADAPEERVGGTLFAEGDATRTVAYAGWPFAFRVPEAFSCSESGQTAVCTADAGDSKITVGWEPCAGRCSTSDRDAMRGELPYQPLQIFQNGDIGVSERTQVSGRWRGALSVFTEAEDGVFHAWSSVDVADFRSEECWQVFNDVLNQAMAKAV